MPLELSSIKGRRRRWHPIPVLLPGKSHGPRSLVGCSPWGLEESDIAEWLHVHFSLLCIGEGNGNPLQCSCLENPRDGVAQSRTRLKWLSSSSSSSIKGNRVPVEVMFDHGSYRRTCFTIYCQACNSSQVVQWKRIHLPMQETQETWVLSLGQEDPLEKEIATHSSVLAWRIPLPEEPGGLQSMVLQRIGHDWATEHTYLFLHWACKPHEFMTCPWTCGWDPTRHLAIFAALQLCQALESCLLGLPPGP